MLLQKYFPDCCDQCCDCERADPKKDKVLISLPKVMEDPVKMTMVPGDAVKPAADLVDGVKLKEFQEATRILEEVALIERQAEEGRDLKRKAEEAQELKRAQQIAEAAEVQEVVEAQELLEAQEASLREHEMMLQKVHASEEARQCEEDRCMTEQRLKEEREDQLKVDCFLKSNGFIDLDSKRTKLFKSFYPLHSAVSKNNAEMVQLLLAAGSRPTLKNSSGLSPLQLAQKLDRNGSHVQVVKLLKFGAG